MIPGEFISKWRASELKERSASQEHFIDLCRLLDEPTPAEADPSGDTYCFEKGARRETGGDGWADVWKRHCFAWEYKGPRADLDAAFDQLRQYALALENPPLLIVSDMRRFRIRTNWTNSVSEIHDFDIEDLADAAMRYRLKWALSDPDRLRPGETRQALTERAATAFASLAQSLREHGHNPRAVAHFVNRLVFCMFAEDVGLLPNDMFTRMLQQARGRPEEFANMARDLFGAMSQGGRVGFETVEWFNGGLFDDDTSLSLEKSEIDIVLENCRLPTPHERVANLIRYIGDQVSQTGESISLSPDHLHAVIGEFSRRSCLSLFDEVKERGIVRFDLGEGSDVLDDSPVSVRIPTQVNLTLEGWKRYEEEKRGSFQGSYGFIAMQFEESALDSLLEKIVRPAVKGSLGYDLVDLRDVARAGVIDNIMRNRIRDAAFVIADLTHDNSGAYWEAGYAEGLGKPVIYICEKAKFEEESTHFDTNHCTTVPWSQDDPHGFREKLIATIRRSLEPV